MTLARWFARCIVAVALAGAAAQPSHAQADAKQGVTLLMRDCSRCHAVGMTGNSPRADAPAFRNLGARYPIESLEEALGEGLMSGHPDMPEIRYDADEVGAIIDYLNAIQKP
ncbi:MAG: c-type cytochrome [Pseudolabrys sp.]|nr:c-type cytochrome [Pseudolabrys sp.]MDP2298630.1 c-type cytochrome [Pseudolabrys sp.]